MATRIGAAARFGVSMIALAGSPVCAQDPETGDALPKIGASEADAQDGGDGASRPSSGEIVVYGSRQPSLFEGLNAEDELGRNDIDAYGLDTVGQILEQIASEVQPGEEGPVVRCRTARSLIPAIRHRDCQY